jgi:hypothetical protein
MVATTKSQLSPTSSRAAAKSCRSSLRRPISCVCACCWARRADSARSASRKHFNLSTLKIQYLYIYYMYMCVCTCNNVINDVVHTCSSYRCRNVYRSSADSDLRVSSRPSSCFLSRSNACLVRSHFVSHSVCSAVVSSYKKLNLIFLDKRLNKNVLVRREALLQEPPPSKLANGTNISA